MLFITTGCQTIMMNTALNGTHWILTDWSRHVLPSDKPVTLDINLAEPKQGGDNTLAGQSFCNRYHTTFTPIGNNVVSIGAVISTRMACTPEKNTFENDFLSQMQNVNRMEMKNGVLVLTTTDDKTLVFSPD